LGDLDVGRTPGLDVLTARLVGAIAVTVLCGVAVSPAVAGAAPVECPIMQGPCVVRVVDPGSVGAPPAANPPDSAVRTCAVPGSTRSVPCTDPLWGWFNNADGCYYKALSGPLAPDDPVYGGDPKGKIVYQVECLLPQGGSRSGGWVALLATPSGFGSVTTTPADLAQEALDHMQLSGASVGIAPPPGSEGLVGVPVWMWTDVTPITWGPNSATATVPGLSVTATAQASKIVWDMGDGTKVTCANPGTKYFPGGVTSPTCGHVYKRSSAGQPNDAYTVTATTTWVVTWTGGGTTGSLTVTRASTTTIRIGELQVLVTG
jgi:hypothetical protein